MFFWFWLMRKLFVQCCWWTLLACRLILDCHVGSLPLAPQEQHDASHPSRCFANNRQEKYPKLYLVLNCFLSSASSLTFWGFRRAKRADILTDFSQYFTYFPNLSTLRALKSPQKFRTSSSANFLGSLYISGLKLKSYYEIWTFWSWFGLQIPKPNPIYYT